MKPWICEDSELGGHELGGNTVILNICKCEWLNEMCYVCVE